MAAGKIHYLQQQLKLSCSFISQLDCGNPTIVYKGLVVPCNQESHSPKWSTMKSQIRMVHLPKLPQAFVAWTTSRSVKTLITYARESGKKKKQHEHKWWETT